MPQPENDQQQERLSMRDRYANLKSNILKLVGIIIQNSIWDGLETLEEKESRKNREAIEFCCLYVCTCQSLRRDILPAIDFTLEQPGNPGQKVIVRLTKDKAEIEKVLKDSEPVSEEIKRLITGRNLEGLKQIHKDSIQNINKMLNLAKKSFSFLKANGIEITREVSDYGIEDTIKSNALLDTLYLCNIWDRSN